MLPEERVLPRLVDYKINHQVTKDAIDLIVFVPWSLCGNKRR